MSIPEKIKPQRLADYLDVMSQAVFQAGIRWAVVEAKWLDFRRAFEDFEPNVVAHFDNAKIDELCGDASLVRSRAKIAATVVNANTMLELARQHGNFSAYLHSFADYDKLAADLKKRFRFMGDMNVYYFLFRVSEPVPEFERWITTIAGHHPRLKEMVEHARRKENPKAG